MNSFPNLRLPLSEPIDFLLADVAIRVQLSSTHHALAVSRYATVNKWIERPGSPLQDRVEIFYPQGSMAIGATIASKLEYDEFDIDLIAQLDLPDDTPPHQMLNILEAAIRGEPGSRYYDMTERCTRCVQVRYADGMHLDVTPMVRIPLLAERCGFIFHARHRHAGVDDRRIVANPWGFAQWFIALTPAERRFVEAFDARVAAYANTIVLAEAEVEPVPDLCPVHEKSMAVIALQLLKRWRNVQYDQREGRFPPSVVLAKFVADNANRTQTLSEELLHQAQQLKLVFEQAQRCREKIVVRNPACESDVFTDRWPECLEAQDLFLTDLTTLVRKLELLRGDCDLATMQHLLSELFGERPTLEAIKSYNREAGRAIVEGRSRHIAGSGRFEMPSAPAVAAVTSTLATTSHATPKHTYFGSTTE
ncbi:MAG TPA: nucleotidyltransferase [Dokdonella sp.]|uniref:nucleotidyltransferase domain-containing protein n=1 Tax=Dokdonella sp. TaxID=2291710 RepID=UPI002D0F0B90|nr:nucleotidyltransferase [Dokdonella sp.]HUD42601.1 nucleotidyltransferase [Dokdonella sp.]